MAIKIAHSAIDENGKAVNGIAGDQTGREVCIQDWYPKGWGFVIRFKDRAMAEKFAKAMEDAAKNNNIGYDQYGRNTVLIEAEKVGWDLSKIAVPCESDCSSLVSVACICAGVPKTAVYVGTNCCTTRTLKSKLQATGLVDVFSGAEYVGTDKNALRGDIYLKEGSHVIVAIEDGENAKKTSSSTTNASDYKNGDVIKLKKGATYYNGRAIPSWVFNTTLYYRGKNNDGIIFSTLKTGAITGVVKPEMIEGYNTTSTPTTPAKKELKNGDVIRLKPNATYANGKTIPAWVFNKTLYYRGKNNEGIIFSTLKIGAITGVVKPEVIEY